MPTIEHRNRRPIERPSTEIRSRAHRARRRSPAQINTTVCAETVEELPAVRDLVADLDALLWSVFFLASVGRGRVLTRSERKPTRSRLSLTHNS
ncbi:MAG: hypothetical protein ABEK02_01025, partial [Haloquadratum sp.]